MAEKAKFQFNGQTYTVKGRLCHDIVKYYVEQNPNATLATLQKAFNTATHLIVATPEMALTVVNSDGKAGGDYYMKEADQIAIKKGKVVVWCYWPENYFKPFMEQVKALGMDVVVQGEEPATGSKEVVEESHLDIKDIKNALVYFSFTSKDGGKYAYAYLIFNRKFYWIDENYDVAEPLSQDTWNSCVELCQQGYYDEIEYDLDSYDSLDEFLEEFGNDKKEGVIEEGYEYPEYLSENGEYVISVFVGAEKVCEKVI